MTKFSVMKMVYIVVLFCVAAVIASPSQTLTTLASFSGANGADPADSLLLASDGNFYGTTLMGGASSAGTIFKMTPAGAITTLHSFAGPEGYYPYAPLVQGHDGNFYGTANSGGAHSIGSVFKITPSGTFTALHFFNYTYGEGGYPGPLVAGSDGYFYGVTSTGGDNGTVFQISADGSTFNTLYYFASSVGKRPSGALLQGRDGNFYGVSPFGGSDGYGTVFRITPSGAASVVYSFCPQGDCTAGASPNGTLLQTSDGNFYGAAGGGTYDGGVIFKVTPGGALTTLHNFNRTDGLNPNGPLVQGSDGNFYGTTVQGGAHGDGTVFQMTPAGALISVHSFAGTDGVNPNGGLIQVNGKFYGTTYTGGANNYGTVYSLTVPPPSLTAVTSSPNPSTVGQVVTMTATVSPGEPGGPLPTGTVSFTSNGTAISGCTNVPLTSSLTAVCMTSTLAVGTDGIVATYSGDNNYMPGSGTLTQIVNPVPVAVQFVPLAPCRVVDTRNPNGPFGGPTIGALSSRAFPLAQSGNPCAIPANAVAYSLNVTVVPQTTLGYLTIWPTGEGQPVVSTLNSLDGRVKANAAIIPAGTPSGSVNVYVTNTTNVVLDIDGYFAPVSGSTLQFYPLTPCRVADTRHDTYPSGLGPPQLSAKVERSFPVLESSCIPPGVNPQAYSFNFTVVPIQQHPVGYLSVWPTGQDQPVVSTLNDQMGTIMANAAIVPAGTSGAVSVFATDDTQLAIDIDGYFAAAGQGGLSLYALTPCRVLDTRHIGTGQPFSGELTVEVRGSFCAPHSTAQAYVFNATAVPAGSLGYLALWPDGQSQPVVSTLNATDGAITSNMAIVPAGTNGKIDAFANNGVTQLLLDISSYFAP